jgi:hypothetical protein
MLCFERSSTYSPLQRRPALQRIKHMFKHLSRKMIPTIALVALTVPVGRAVAQSTSTSTGNSTTLGITGTDPVPTSPGAAAVILSLLPLLFPA